MTKESPTSNVDLVTKYRLKGYAVISRETVLKNIADAECMTERVYWALILYSWCGPEVREACWLKTDTGHLARDPQTGEFIPLQAKHVLRVLGLGRTGYAHFGRCMDRLQEQGRLVKKDDLWYPVMVAPKVVAPPPSDDSLTSTCKPALRFRWMGFDVDLGKIPEDACRDAIKCELVRIREECNLAIKNARACARSLVSLQLSPYLSLFSEELEELEELEEGEEAPAAPPRQPSVEPSPEPDPAPEQPPVVALTITTTPEAKEREGLWDSFVKLMAGCGKPVSPFQRDACRKLFFNYPLKEQQKILTDATIRADEHWNRPRFTPDPLKHLESQDWDLRPVRPRSLPEKKGNSATQQRAEAMERVLERARARDRQEAAAAGK